MSISQSSFSQATSSVAGIREVYGPTIINARASAESCAVPRVCSVVVAVTAAGIVIALAFSVPLTLAFALPSLLVFPLPSLLILLFLLSLAFPFSGMVVIVSPLTFVVRLGFVVSFLVVRLGFVVAVFVVLATVVSTRIIVVRRYEQVPAGWRGPGEAEADGWRSSEAGVPVGIDGHQELHIGLVVLELSLEEVDGILRGAVGQEAAQAAQALHLLRIGDHQVVPTGA